MDRHAIGTRMAASHSWSCDPMSDDAAALLEPLSVAVATARRAKLTVGSRVLSQARGRSASSSRRSLVPTGREM